ncbi:MAG: hypothetical protein VX642_10210 [Bdellovibrionota bacterium]|nr:hypothetical protein [Bdellovibrionota bacterium]
MGKALFTTLFLLLIFTENLFAKICIESAEPKASLRTRIYLLSKSELKDQHISFLNSSKRIIESYEERMQGAKLANNVFLSGISLIKSSHKLLGNSNLTEKEQASLLFKIHYTHVLLADLWYKHSGRPQSISSDKSRVYFQSLLSELRIQTQSFEDKHGTILKDVFSFGPAAHENSPLSRLGISAESFVNSLTQGYFINESVLYTKFAHNREYKPKEYNHHDLNHRGMISRGLSKKVPLIYGEMNFTPEIRERFFRESYATWRYLRARAKILLNEKEYEVMTHLLFQKVFELSEPLHPKAKFSSFTLAESLHQSILEENFSLELSSKEILEVADWIENELKSIHF